MKIILLKDIPNIGKEGQTIEIKNGYARNFLIPNGLAMAFTKESLARLEHIKKRRERVLETKKKHFQELAQKINSYSLTIPAEIKDGEEIYGSITEGQIIKALSDEGVEVAKGTVELKEPIKKIGAYHIKIILYPEIEANLRLWVVKK